VVLGLPLSFSGKMDEAFSSPQQLEDLAKLDVVGPTDSIVEWAPYGCFIDMT